MEKEVIEYFLDGDNYIKGWQLHPKEKRPDLLSNPDPLPEMNDPGSLTDKYGKPKYKLVGNQILAQPRTATTTEILDEKRNRLLLKFARLLLDAMYDQRTWAACCTAVKNYIDADVNGNIKL